MMSMERDAGEGAITIAQNVVSMPAETGQESGVARYVIGSSFLPRKVEAIGLSSDDAFGAGDDYLLPPAPHDGVVNAREVEMCLETHHCRLAFADDAYVNTASVRKGKYFLGRSHVPEIREKWLDRYLAYKPSAKLPSSKPFRRHGREYAAGVVETVTTVYTGFVKLIVAEFIFKWNVDYNYEEANDGKALTIHPNVMRIFNDKKGAHKCAHKQAHKGKAAERGVLETCAGVRKKPLLRQPIVAATTAAGGASLPACPAVLRMRPQASSIAVSGAAPQPSLIPTFNNASGSSTRMMTSERTRPMPGFGCNARASSAPDTMVEGSSSPLEDPLLTAAAPVMTDSAVQAGLGFEWELSSGSVDFSKVACSHRNMSMAEREFWSSWMGPVIKGMMAAHKVYVEPGEGNEVQELRNKIAKLKMELVASRMKIADLEEDLEDTVKESQARIRMLKKEVKQLTSERAQWAAAAAAAAARRLETPVGSDKDAESDEASESDE